MEVRRGEQIKKDGEVIGNRTKIKVVKNKVAPPFRTAEVDIVYGEGISRVGELLDIAADEKIIVKSGAWYAYEGDKIGQGRENAKVYLTEHPDILAEVERKVREKLFDADAKEEEDAPAATEGEVVPEDGKEKK